MTNIPQSQGSSEWLAWRRTIIGASDVPIILGLSPWRTRHDLLLEKRGEGEPQKTNWAMSRGTEAEPKIRKLYEESVGVLFPPLTVVWAEWPTLGASLDGFSHELDKIVEFKYPNKETYEKAKNGVIPEHYYAQVQAQLLCSGADHGDFVCFNGSDLAVVHFRRDNFIIEKIIVECRLFWEEVQSKEPPKPEVEEIVDENLEQLLWSYEDVSKEISALQKLKEEMKEELEALIVKDKISCGGFTATWVCKKGSVDYSKIEILKTIDLDQYRKKESRYLLIKAKETKNEV